MKRTFLMAAGVASGVLALSGCDPYPTDAGVEITIDNPTQGQDNVPLQFTAAVGISGDFTLGDPGCDPTQFEVDADHLTLHPLWDPYSCSGVDANGEPAQNSGNIQFFVDGIFFGMHTDADVEVDLSPKLEYAFYDYEYADTDDDGVPDTPINFNGNLTAEGEPYLDDDAFYICSFWLPADNLGYAQAFYDTFSSESYEDLYEEQLLDYSTYDPDTYDPADETTWPQPLTTQPVGSFELFGYGFWYENFDYFGINGEGYVDRNADDEIDDADWVDADLHIFYPELHANNHSPIYGANRPRVVTGQLDFSTMPDNWCGFVLGVGSPYWL